MKTRGIEEQQLTTFSKKTRDEIEKKTGKSPEQLFSDREKRITDVIQLKVPDRVPVCLSAGYFPVKYAGLPASTMFYDPVAYKEALVKTLLDFESDTLNPANITSGLALEKSGPNQYLWPGGTLQSDQNAQFVDAEVMTENEYDLFTDPGDFMLRYYLPRRFGALAPLSKMPPLQSLAAISSLPGQLPSFGSPEILHAFETLYQAGQEQVKYGQLGKEISDTMGIPLLCSYSGALAVPPFDLFVSYLRGLRGTLVDMFRQPEKLLAGCEKVLEWHLARTLPAGPKEIGKRVLGGGNHFQSEEFLSKKQFETFAWPTWKKILLAIIEKGYIPGPFMEGKNDDRIECFLELPKGKAFIRFDTIDMARAKAILGDHFCIVGAVPPALLWGGSPQDVEDYCKNLIRVCGKGGGFILDSSCTLDNAKPANVKAMVDSVKKYGRY